MWGRESSSSKFRRCDPDAGRRGAAALPGNPLHEDTVPAGDTGRLRRRLGEFGPGPLPRWGTRPDPGTTAALAGPAQCRGIPGTAAAPGPHRDPAAVGLPAVRVSGPMRSTRTMTSVSW